MEAKRVLWLLLLISGAMHFSYFSRELTGFHVWRQTQTQSTILNFYEEDMQILNPRKNDRGDGTGIFRMEFPLMQWSIACLYQVFGKHLWITRLCMFIISLCSAMGMYFLVYRLFTNRQIALIAAWALSFSPCFFYYAVNPLPDNLALCFSIWGIVNFVSWIQNNNPFNLLVCGILLSLGTLCKLPFILYFAAPASYLIAQLFTQKSTFTQFCSRLGTVFGLAIFPLLWYVWVIPTWHHTEIDGGILTNTESWHTILDYLKGNLISVLPELLLNYGSVPLFLAGLFFLFRNQSYKHPYFIFFSCWGLSVLAYFFFEINLIGVMHDYYLFPFFPLLFVMVSYGAASLLKTEQRWMQKGVYFLLLILPLTCYLRIQSRWNKDSVGFNKDYLTYKTELRNAVPKDALCIVGNDESHFIHFYFVDKKGWAIDHDQLDVSQMEEHIKAGAQYLYFDGEPSFIEQHAAHIDYLQLERGSVRVYKLK
jgi:hypothetical protein